MKHLSALALTSIVEKVLTAKDAYGSCTIGRGKRILLEFVSSNPTGPLHVGHGRLAAFGSVVANLLEEVGFKPYKEYYVNDSGGPYCQDILNDIKADLAEFGVNYDNWFSEREFIATGRADVLLEKLTAGGHVCRRDGALWFKSTDFADEKDRVLIQSNGQRTYFANDVAYHLDKFDRGYDIAMDIFGADRLGLTQRMKAAVETSGINPERLINLLIQFVTLYRAGQPVSMSMRGGSLVTLRELRHEVGNDTARFFYVMQKADQHMDFDLDLAKSQSMENPLYAIQSAYARIASVFHQMQERELPYNEAMGLAHVDLLTQKHEHALLNTLSRYPEIVIDASLNYEPHLLTNYLRELAADFHAYYNAHAFLVEDDKLRPARLVLISAVRQVILNGLNIISIKPH